MPLITGAVAALAIHLGAPAVQQNETSNLVQKVQYCGDGYDLDIRGRCYPNGVIPPQFQAARQGYAYYGRGYYGRHPVPCGDGADLDIRDGRCYPTGTVPYRYQNRPHYYYRY